MKLQFIIRGKKRNLSYRITNGRNGLSTVRSLPLVLQDSDSWNKKTYLTDNNTEMNIELNRFKQHLINNFNKSVADNIVIDKDWINNLHQKYFHPEKVIDKSITLLFDYFNTFKTRHSSKINLIARINQIEKHLSGKNIKLVDINYNYMDDYQQYLTKERFAPATINKYMDVLKMILREAVKEDYNIRQSTFSVKSIKNEGISYHLNESELNQLSNFNPPTEALRNTKNLFLIGCSTGMRFSDLKRIKQFPLIDGMLSVTTQKTKQNILIPLPAHITPLISEVKILGLQCFNRNLKSLFKAMKLDTPLEGYVIKNRRRTKDIYPKYELISSHTMRRTFATNLYGKLNTTIIMAITGHTTEKSFLTYIKRPQLSFAEELKAFYDKQLDLVDV